ncbi:dipeptidyl peptidase 3-like isoform X1 [Mytilus californianus]|uniref:dipeptidyl peptidase 3-like isoform X1 n=2 Tax=Mytilus californianus TaxID=6549 RepID=UPI0022477B6C|nr:dipeptidyl peptidase 3-like isoform X1 [Mytilus californianus]
MYAVTNPLKICRGVRICQHLHLMTQHQRDGIFPLLINERRRSDFFLCQSVSRPASRFFSLSRMSTDISQYIIPNDTGVCLLDCITAFEGLTPKERLYAHYIAQASWYGGLIVLVQTSPESPGIFILLQKIFRTQPISEVKSLAIKQGITEEEWQAIMIYCAAFYANSGNYKAFGDTKFIPNVPKDKFESLVLCCKAAVDDPKGIKALWDSVSDRMFSLVTRQKELGLGEKGTTTYYSSNCNLDDAKLAQEFIDSKDLSAYNTRLFKTEKNGQTCYEVRLASALTEGGSIEGCPEGILGTHQFTSSTSKSCSFTVTRGDYSKLMAKVAENLGKAKEHVANDLEKQMLTEYIKSFTTGSIPAHKDGSRHWIKNIGPIVETYIGFIESYRDPFGVRGEFEGFAAVVNKEMSKQFAELVNNAEHLLALLPWPAAYEKDKFLKPDFTSLDVLAFGGSGIPAGINIPNYDDIRQSEGFKNVSLGNVLIAAYQDTKVSFLDDEDTELFIKLKIPSFEVQVGLHELLGHGSGKLFIKGEDGKFNFDIDTVEHTETKDKITKWYNQNETWDSKFTTLASTYEECRAECVGIYLCLSADALRIFGHKEDTADDLIYINWLNMARAGLLALEFYSPDTGSWRQAHMNGRYVILRVMIEAGQGLITITKTTGDDGKEDIHLKLDRTKILPVGKPAIGNFLRKLQVYKSTGDVEAATAMYGHYSEVHDDEEPHFLSLRSVVLARKTPRKMMVQHNTTVEGPTVKLQSYESSADGLVQSFIDRFPTSEVDDILKELMEKDQQFFTT